MFGVMLGRSVEVMLSRPAFAWTEVVKVKYGAWQISSNRLDRQPDIYTLLWNSITESMEAA